jgi:uncharacterized protein with HEPN domain
MAELPDRDAALLLDMLLAAQDAQGFIAGLGKDAFLESRLHQSAVIRALEIIGEAANNVSPATQAEYPEIPWREITGMRHRLIHGYADVDLDRVWDTVQSHLHPLIAVLERIVPSDSNTEQ